MPKLFQRALELSRLTTLSKWLTEVWEIVACPAEDIEPPSPSLNAYQLHLMYWNPWKSKVRDGDVQGMASDLPWELSNTFSLTHIYRRSIYFSQQPRIN
ncbi:hypothetical protein LguiB_017337 [Lonicera macranthoides]